MSRSLSRPHTLNIEDQVWDNLVSHSSKRGESASQFTNLVLKDALGMLSTSTATYSPGDISVSAQKPPLELVEKPLWDDAEWNQIVKAHGINSSQAHQYQRTHKVST